jgi:hypothetical protein
LQAGGAEWPHLHGHTEGMAGDVWREGGGKARAPLAAMAGKTAAAMAVMQRDQSCQETSTRDTADKRSLELYAPIVLILLEDGCGEWCVSVVFLPGQVINNRYL